MDNGESANTRVRIYFKIIIERYDAWSPSLEFKYVHIHGIRWASCRPNISLKVHLLIIEENRKNIGMNRFKWFVRHAFNLYSLRNIKKVIGQIWHIKQKFIGTSDKTSTLLCSHCCIYLKSSFIRLVKPSITQKYKPAQHQLNWRKFSRLSNKTILCVQPDLNSPAIQQQSASKIHFMKSFNDNFLKSNNKKANLGDEYSRHKWMIEYKN